MSFSDMMNDATTASKPSWETESDKDKGVTTSNEVKVENQTTTQTTSGNTPNSNGKVNIYEDPIQGVPLDPSKFKRFDRTFTVYSSDATIVDDKPSIQPIPQDVIQQVVEVAISLAEKGFTFRYNGDANDALATAVKNAVKDSTDTFMAWKSFNPEFSTNFTKPTLEAYQYTAAFYGFTNPRTQQTVNPFTECRLPDPIRAIKVAEFMSVMGAKCDKPSNLVIAYTHNGIESDKEIRRETDFKTKSYVPFCNKIDIPLFNLKAGRLDALKEFVKTFN